MKQKLITILFFFSFSFSLFSQETAIQYDVRGIMAKPIKRTKLVTAQTMQDINPGYPSSWIKKKDYISSKISVVIDGVIKHAAGKNDILTEEQKTFLKSADVGTEISVKVLYNYGDFLSGEFGTKNVNFSVTLLPDIEAEYIGGYLKLKEYLKLEAIDQISKMNYDNNQITLVRFTINKEGKPSDIKLIKTSDDIEIDNIIIDAVKLMPNWKPAETSTGIKVKQEFELYVGNGC